MQIEHHDGNVALLRMRHGRANAIDGKFLRALHDRLDEVAGARALVLTGEGSIFSAGLDLPALVALERSEVEQFIDDFSGAMLRLFELPIPVVAAINGHAIAGGCVLALQADYRLMAKTEARIGLNEVVLGIGLPAVVVETLRHQVPSSALRPIALEGQLFLPQEAADLGLVDDVVVSDELLGRALERARLFAAQPAGATRQIKLALRRGVVAAIHVQRASDARIWADTVYSDEGRRLLSEAVARLGARRR